MSETKCVETSPVDAVVVLELWNHGTAGETMQPCGEVDIFNVTGERIDAGILKILMADKHSLKFDWFGGLPTEQCLLVEAAVAREDDEYWLRVKNWKELEA